MLFATVRQRKIYVKAPQTVVKDGVNVDVLKLEMDDEWAEMTSIICVFSNGSVKKEVMHTFGQPITVPWECLESTGVLMLGITGYVGTQKVMTTMNADNGWEIVQNSETTGEEQFDATPTLTQQLLEAATSANNAAAAANTAKQDILDAVNNGEFDGAPGKDGADGQPGADGYSPSAKVTQTASGAEITITDKGGTTTATVTNGKDGAAGKDGAPGAAGKSAYKYAQDGGYTGTEEEFSGKMAAEIPSIDNTLTKSGQAADAAVVGDRLRSLSEEIANIAGGNGLTTAQINALDGMFKVCAFIKADVSEEYNAFRTAFDIEAATITGISATYTGGNVTAGTSVDALTGIVVTANYSDGSKRTVTGYTLSGTIAEGSNTITVTYEGMTTTFTVIGVAEAVILSSISVTYSGGSVPAGTALDDLTGILVTATYSDGSTSTVTGYTLSGEIAEGNNTITVTYKGKTATFVVTGTAVAQTYTVTNNLTNVTNSNSATTASGYYSATLSAAEGYNINVIITMGGVDITADVYTEDGTILIAEVTGDIVITATAELASAYTVLYQLSDTPKSVSGLLEDTGITFGAEDANGYTKALTICVAYTGFDANETLMKMSSGRAVEITTNAGGSNTQIRVTSCSNAVTVNPEISDSGDYRVVITKEATSVKTLNIHTLSSGAVATIENVGTYGNFSHSVCAGNLIVGDSDITVNKLVIYEGILSDAHIATFLSGGEV